MIEKRALDLDEQDRITRREKRLAMLLPEEQEATRNAMNLSDAKQDMGVSALPYAVGTPAPRIEAGVTQAIPSPRIVEKYWHAETMEAALQVGTFCELPIVEVDVEDAEDTALAVLETPADLVQAYDDTVVGPALAQLREEEYNAKIALLLLPGEVVCADGIIRRATTTEVIGYDKYKSISATGEEAEGKLRRVSIADAKLASNDGMRVTWRPTNEEFAYIHVEAPYVQVEGEDPFELSTWLWYDEIEKGITKERYGDWKNAKTMGAKA